MAFNKEKENEYIRHYEDDAYAWLCVCGNNTDGWGFYPCDGNGKLSETNDGTWKGLYACYACPRIFSLETLEIVGWKRGYRPLLTGK